MITPSSSPLASVEHARSIYRTLKTEADQKRAEAKANGDKAPEFIRRLRSATNAKGEMTINLNKASPNCEHCGGTGRRPDHVEKDPDTGEETAIPVICRCVHKNGGVAKDTFDRMVAAEEGRQRWAKRRKQRRKQKRKLKRKHRPS
jgi:hypothetical protein